MTVKGTDTQEAGGGRPFPKVAGATVAGRGALMLVTGDPLMLVTGVGDLWPPHVKNSQRP